MAPTTGNVRLLSVVRLSDRLVLTTHVHYPVLKSVYDDVLAKVANSNMLETRDKLTVTSRDVGAIHYCADATLCFIVMTAASYPQRVAFKLLEELKEQYAASVGTAADSVTRSNALNSKACRMMARIAARYEDIQQVDQLARIQGETTVIRDIMHDNISAIIQRGDDIAELDDRAATLAVDAKVFTQESRQVKRSMIVRNFKLWTVLAIVLIAIAVWVAIAFLAPVIYIAARYVVVPAALWIYDQFKGDEGAGLNSLVRLGYWIG